jgi:hypothetical protein
MLLTAYPQFLEAGWFDYDSYLWAAELWYSYAFEVSHWSCLCTRASGTEGGIQHAAVDRRSRLIQICAWVS